MSRTTRSGATSTSATATTVWNPGWKPTKTPLDRYECRHGLGYTRIVGAKDGVEVELLFFVPPGENVEIWQTTVRNIGGGAEGPVALLLRRVLLLRGAERHDELPAHVLDRRGRGRGLRAIYHTTEYRERRDHYTLFGCTRDVGGFDTSRDAFVGVHNGLHEAAVPFAGAATGSIAHGWNPIGSHQVDLRLAPGEEETFAFVLAYVEQGDIPKFERPGVVNKAQGGRSLARYRKPGAVDAAFARPRGTWDDLLSRVPGRLPRPARGRGCSNTWNQYQCMATFNLSRSASFYETGIGRGMGFRDSNQDVLGFVHLIPERARQRILDLAATQLSDGTCFHQYQPLTQAGKRRDRRRLLRRPPLARALDVRVREGDGRRVDPREPRRLRGHARQRRGPAAPPRDERRLHALAIEARTGCR